MTYLVPTHAYVPGQNERHSEDAFASVCETAQPGMSAEALAECAAFKHGLHYLEQGHFWEAHEVLEPVWMALPDGIERQFTQGLIQLANALLKARMDRPKAALRLCAMARGLIEVDGETVMGTSRDIYLRQIADAEEAVGGAL